MLVGHAYSAWCCFGTFEARVCRIACSRRHDTFGILSDPGRPWKTHANRVQFQIFVLTSVRTLAVFGAEFFRILLRIAPTMINEVST